MAGQRGWPRSQVNTALRGRREAQIASFLLVSSKVFGRGGCSASRGMSQVGQTLGIHNIAVGVDFSLDAESAVRLAVSLCKESGAKLVLIHVGPAAVAGPASRLPSVREWGRLVAIRAQEAEARMEQLLSEVRAEGADASCIVVDGEPAEALATAADVSEADLLVVGTHGLGAAKHFLLGSVAERVVRLATCNVLVTREGADETVAPRRILLATDFSAHAEIALRVAIDFAGQGGTVDIVHFWDLSPIVSSLIGSETEGSVIGALGEEMELDVVERGAKLLAAHQRQGITLSFEAIRGKASNGIVQWQKNSDHPYDLVVTGSHGRRGIRRFFLGSVAETVVRNATCSALVVHQRPKSG